MRLAFTTLGCPAWTLDQIIENAVSYGYQGVELRGLGEHVDLRQSPVFQPSERAAVRRRFVDSGLTICCLGASSSFADPDKRDASLTEARDYVVLAAELGSPFVRVFGGSPGEKGACEDTVQAVADSLSALAPYAAEHGVTLVLETHDHFSTGRQVNEVLSRVNHPQVRALWDLHHPFRQGETPTETYQSVAPFLKHTHVKDSQKGHYCLLGEGDVPVPEMLSLLATHPYADALWISLEWEKRWHPDIAEPEIAFPQYARTLRALLERTL